MSLILYHGTSSGNIQSILARGLDPVFSKSREKYLLELEEAINVSQIAKETKRVILSRIGQRIVIGRSWSGSITLVDEPRIAWVWAEEHCTNGGEIGRSEAALYKLVLDLVPKRDRFKGLRQQVEHHLEEIVYDNGSAAVVVAEVPESRIYKTSNCFRVPTDTRLVLSSIQEYNTHALNSERKSDEVKLVREYQAKKGIPPRMLKKVITSADELRTHISKH